jgi:hypothetical protein
MLLLLLRQFNMINQVSFLPLHEENGCRVETCRKEVDYYSTCYPIISTVMVFFHTVDWSPIHHEEVQLDKEPELLCLRKVKTPNDAKHEAKSCLHNHGDEKICIQSH